MSGAADRLPLGCDIEWGWAICRVGSDSYCCCCCCCCCYYYYYYHYLLCGFL
ncbi:hypothetical protein BO82DRAFT_15675 [Aspergillus uvarum CBS 121591]|uniref:Uncharacterized protein n=1 Tax=Aspergillus uvarum CBS 121591 TaxID=1448315 RepID=A0A319CMK6_9EURO|nr:hypothetical protein BO82DRAFT_15675 [Aspergillus uvarum CBS 121591]PYH84307.1 hypothetical protein BO82DRAFT_15675 [Aspergillus uvarum CBS 121591]